MGAVVLGIIFLVAVVGYATIGNRGFLESVFMVVITISGVGYSESTHMNPPLQAFTIAVIAFGMSATAYTLGGLIQMMTEGEIHRALGQQRTTRGVERLKDHVILCGFGLTGRILAHDLFEQGVQFVIIENNPDRIADAHDHKYLTVSGDASEEEELLAAGVERARALVIGLPNDAANVFITLTSRNLNPDMQIIARAARHSTQKKLIQAGADRVVMPAAVGAQRMARMITRPTTADVIELVGTKSRLDVEMEEFTVPEKSPLVGTTVRDAEANRKHRLLIVAVKQDDGNMVFNPDADYTFRANDTLIVMGRLEDVERFQQEHGI